MRRIDFRLGSWCAPVFMPPSARLISVAFIWYLCDPNTPYHLKPARIIWSSYNGWSGFNRLMTPAEQKLEQFLEWLLTRSEWKNLGDWKREHCRKLQRLKARVEKLASEMRGPNNRVSTGRRAYREGHRGLPKGKGF